MGRKIKRIIYWWSRRSHLPVLIIGAIVVVVLFLNDETSISTNMRYEKEINRMKAEIQQNLDSAEFYRLKRESMLSGGVDLEYAAREQYHLQRPTEDVYLIKSSKSEVSEEGK